MADTSGLPSAERGQVSLDSPPPQPPGKTQKTLMDTQQNTAGALPQTPLVSAMTGFQMIREGSAMISSALPGIAPALADMVQRLQDVIPKAAAESSGMLPTGPPGVAGPMPPPPM